MRLNRLDLTRYGRFKDANIVFPQPSQGSPDVTVIFGPNEAGKSTAFNGLLELLFGFQARSHPYAFRYQRSDLLVGGELDFPGRGAVALRRNSKKDNSLLDENDRAIDEAFLLSALHGLTREQYENRFSLNDKGLREGGERIADAKGDLGQLLHAGLSGLTGMSQALDVLDNRADGFHKKRAHSSDLAKGKNRLKDIQAELKDNYLTTEREQTLRSELERSQIEFKESEEELQQTNRRTAALKAAEVWHEQSEKIKQLEDNLADFPDGPKLPAKADGLVSGLVQRISDQKKRIAEAEENIEQKSKIVEEHPINELFVPLNSELEQLEQTTIDGSPLMGRARTVRSDLDSRNKERDELLVEINKVLVRLKVPDAHVSTLAFMTEDLEGLNNATAQCLEARHRVEGAQKAFDDARTQQDDAPDEPKDFTNLRTAYKSWIDVGDVAVFQSEQDSSEERLNKATSGLPKSWQDLIAAGLPAPETLVDVNQKWLKLDSDLQSARNVLDSSTSDLSESRALLSVQENALKAADLAKPGEIRRQRDSVWLKHKSDLTSQSAGEFEKAMHADDDAGTNNLKGVEGQQRLLTAQEGAQVAQIRHENAKKRLEELDSEKNRMAEKCSQLALALGLDKDTTPSAFRERHREIKAAGEAAVEFANAEKSITGFFARQEAAREGLSNATLALGFDFPQDDLPSRVQHELMLEESNRKAWGKWQEGENKIAELDSDLKQCLSDIEHVQHKLTSLTATLPLPDRSLEAIQAVLPDLRILGQHNNKLQELTTQIEFFERITVALNDSASRLTSIIGGVEGELNATAIINLAKTQVDNAKQATQKREAAEEDINKYEKFKRQAESDRDEAIEELNARFNEQAGSDLEPLERIAKLVERDGLRFEKETAEGECKKARAGVDENLFVEELNRMPDVTRASELEQELQDAQIKRDTARDAQSEASRLYDEAFAAADRSDLATERATLLEVLRDGAREAAIARLGVLTARGALRRLAEDQRSGMLKDVEKAFVNMTDSAWTGVEAWTETEGEKLVGIMKDGSQVPVNKMSTGTMGQLYFALRLAGYHSFAQEPGPLPMVLDDIMETFDDTRARAALKLCAEIGETGQAILFTHHAHLVELAKETIEGVNVVKMAA